MGPATEAVKADLKFAERHELYCQQSNGGCLQESLHMSLINIGDAILGLVSCFGGLVDTSRNPQHYLINDTRKPQGGVLCYDRNAPKLIIAVSMPL